MCEGFGSLTIICNIMYILLDKKKIKMFINIIKHLVIIKTWQTSTLSGIK